MTTQDLINTLRQGAPVTARQVKAIVNQLERIPAMERGTTTLQNCPWPIPQHGLNANG